MANVALAALLGAALVLRLAQRAGELDLGGFALGWLTGYVVADVTSGLVHWFCDTYFAPATPLVGPMFIAPFREHHVDPAALARHGVFERNGNNCLVSLPVFVLGLLALQPDVGATVWLDAGRGFLVAFAFTLCLTRSMPERMAGRLRAACACRAALETTAAKRHEGEECLLFCCGPLF